MILVVGGTGTLGTHVVRALHARRLAVRVLTRDPARGAHLGVELVRGDVTDPQSVARAMRGVRTLVLAMHGFAGVDAAGTPAVDRDGTVHALEAARAAGVEHVVLVSVLGASPSHPMVLFRMKHAAEQALHGSGIAWTIVRPSAFMETWVRLLGDPMRRTRRTLVFGRGRTPINFVSARDVAHVVEHAVVSESLRGRAIDVDGPENRTMLDIADVIARELGMPLRARHVPRAAMRVASMMLAFAKPVIAAQVRAGLVMDTAPDQTRPTPAWPAALGIGSLATFDDVVREWNRGSSAGAVDATS